jgi:hypothetical protein
MASERLTLVRVLQFLIPAAGVSVALVSVLLSVAARKKELTCTLLNMTRLVSENLGGISPDMRVEFRGQAIYSLSKMTFSLRNSGAAAVRAQDVSDPVHLQFPPGAKLLSASVERTLPLKFSFSARQDSEANQVVIDFPLLNSGDEGVFSVYVLNSEPQRPSFEGRVVDVPQLIYAESTSANGAGSDWPHWSHATRTVVRRSMLGLYGLATLAAAGLWLYEVFTKLRYTRWKPRWSTSYGEVAKEIERREEEDMNRRMEQVRIEMENLDPANKEIYMRDSARRTVEIFSADRALRDRTLRDELKKKGIPRRPDPITDTFGDFLSFSLVFVGLAVVFGFTAVVVHTALPG